MVRNIRITVVLNSEEKKAIAEAAKNMGVSIPTFLRICAMEKVSK